MNENIKTYELDSDYGGKYTVKPNLDMYVDYKNLYVGLDCFDNEFGYWEPYGDVTVNVNKLPYLYGAIDTNNNGDKIVDFLEANGFGERTGMQVYSGYCTFPVFRFNEEKLKEIDPEAFTKYAKAHGEEKEPLDNKISKANSKVTAPTCKGPNKEQER